MMKYVKIGKYDVGLVFRNGEYKKVLTQGGYWLTWFDEVKTYRKMGEFNTPDVLEILLEDKALASMLEVFKVADNEMALLFEDGELKEVLRKGQYAFWKGLKTYTYQIVDLDATYIDQDLKKNWLDNAYVAQYIRKFQVEAYEQAALFIDGKFEKVVNGGVYQFWRNAKSVVLSKVDLRQQQMEVAGQEILTKDKAALRINFTLNYKVVDVEKAVLTNKDFAKQLYVFSQMALRAYIGTLSLDELLAEKVAMENYILNELKAKSATLGLQVLDCGIKDVILPGEVKDIMNKVLVAQKQAQANIITRREETASTRSLLNTAKLMEENAMLLKLKEMEYVEKIAEKINNISLSGGNQVVDQLKEIFVVK